MANNTNNVISLGTGEPPQTSDEPVLDDSAAIAKQFQNTHPKRWIKLRLAVLILLTLAAATTDVSLIYELLKARFTDDFGVSVGTAATLMIGSATTLLGFFFIGEAFKTPGWSRRGAIAAYIVLLAFLGFALYPSHTAEIEAFFRKTIAYEPSTWVNSASGTGIAKSSAPLWFTCVALTMLAIVYTFPGLAFIYLKNRILDAVEDFRLFDESSAILESHKNVMTDIADENQKRRNARYFGDSANVNVVAQNTLSQAITTYVKSLEDRLATIIMTKSNTRYEQATMFAHREKIEGLIRNAKALI